MTIPVNVVRQKSTDDGTPGRLHATQHDGSIFECDTLELPPADNVSGRSCIKPMFGEAPETYHAVLWESPHLGSPHHKEVEGYDGKTFDIHRRVYRLEDKHKRKDCLVHNANFAGEVNAGEETQLHGCTATGDGYGELDRTDGQGKQMGILNSVRELERFIEFTKGEDVDITYSWAEEATDGTATDAVSQT